MKIQTGRIAKIEKALAEANGNELPKIAIQFGEDCYRLDGETLTAEEFAAYSDEWDARGFSVIVVALSGPEAEASRVRFLEEQKNPETPIESVGENVQKELTSAEAAL